MTTPFIPGPEQPPTLSTLLPAGPPPKRSRAAWWVLGAVALVLLGGTAFVGAWLFVDHGGKTADTVVTTAAKAGLESRLTRTKSVCDAGDTGTRVADGGKTLIVDGAGEEDGGVGVDNDTLECILVVLDAPESVKEHVYQTRALDGRQQDTWPGFTASWSYHPDSGVEMILTAS